MLTWLKSLFASASSISVSIPVADAMPNRDELAKRNEITDELDASGFGKFIGAGGGFNQMDFQYDVADTDAAKAQLAEVMARQLPGIDYSVTVE